MGLSCRENLNNIDNILQKSDELLYEAKKSGRNRLIRFNR
jgi:PleD family two-component response regulator